MSDDHEETGARGGPSLSDVGSGADAVGEARQALQAAGSTLDGAGQAARTAQGLVGRASDLGRAVSSLSSAVDAARHIVPDNQVRDVLSTAGQVGNAVHQGTQALDSLGNVLGGQRNDDVEFHLEVAGTGDSWAVNSVSLSEALSTPSTCVVEARYADHIAPPDLLFQDVTLRIERREQSRSFKGMVWHTTVDEEHDGVHVRLHVVSALTLLEKTFDSGIYQQKTVPAIIEAVFNEVLGPTRRTIRNETQRTYELREYTVQYQESCMAFVSRLAEEEGIFWYFDHDGDEDHEVMVLVDTVSGLPQARADRGGRVQYHGDPSQAPDGEAAWYIAHTEELGVTDVVVADYDWTHPSLDVRGEQTGRGNHEPALESYEHRPSLVFHKFNGTQYEENTAAVQARLRAERFDLERQHWTMSTSVVTAAPGHLLELFGGPEGDLDQRYLIVSSSASGGATEGASGYWQNSLDVVPASMPYRSPRRTPRPLVHGPETARVVGPGEIHTDEHGRVRVHFHWDRGHARDAEDSSCWLRVAHNWAGAGFGTFFLPRVGMEVVVSFLGGNPDRPLVTGCVYNGENRAKVDLDAKKTQTVIRTKSSPNSDGFNELRFEDEAGSEFIFTHAQKDYNEVVENNHSTHVKNNQTNTVDVDQTETVGRDQRMTVKRDRTKAVDGTETSFIGGGETPGHRLETVWGNEEVAINQNRTHTITGDDTLTVTEGKRTVTVEVGKNTETYHGGRETTVLEFDNLTVDGGANRNTHVTGQYNIKSDKHFKLVQNSINELTIDDSMYAAMVARIQLKAGDGAVHYDATPDGTLTIKATTKIVLECGGAKLELSSDGTVKINGSTVEVAGAGSALKLDSSGAATSGAKVTSTASGVNEIKGALVKIN